MVGNGPHSADLGAKVFFIWGSLCILSVAFAYFLAPETKGLSLEQIDKMMEETTPRKSSSWVPHSTFARDMGLANEDHVGHKNDVGHAEVVNHNEKSAV